MHSRPFWLASNVWYLFAVWCMINVSLVWASGSPFDKGVQAEEIVRRCNYKDAGHDQRTKLIIHLRDAQGRERRSVYRRLWKDYQLDRGEIADKMVLFTEYPPDAKGAAFMRWAFMPSAAKSAQQWIYLPVLRKIRRVSIRDLSESFLGSDLTYGDISLRALAQDEHKLLRIVPGRSGQFFLVQSTPKEANAQYGKKLQWFSRTTHWDGCLNLRTDYFDHKGELLKRQFLRWQKVKGAWVWDQVLVENVQTYHSSLFKVEEVEVNTGIEDGLFSERTLRASQR